MKLVCGVKMDRMVCIHYEVTAQLVGKNCRLSFDICDCHTVKGNTITCKHLFIRFIRQDRNMSLIQKKYCFF